MLIQVGQHEASVELLEVALTAAPAKPKYSTRLLVAHQRAGRVQPARELIEHGLNPAFLTSTLTNSDKTFTSHERSHMRALNPLIENGKHVSAEIAARLMVKDYPDSAAVKSLMHRVLRMMNAA